MIPKLGKGVRRLCEESKVPIIPNRVMRTVFGKDADFLSTKEETQCF